MASSSTDQRKDHNVLTELEYLRLFYQEADFGPAHGDVVAIINDNIREETGKKLPEGYGWDEEE